MPTRYLVGIVAFYKGSRNVFADLGFPESEAQNLALRSDLMIRIEKLVQDRGMTQQQAAKTLGVTQLRLTALLKGKSQISARMPWSTGWPMPACK